MRRYRRRRNGKTWRKYRLALFRRHIACTLDGTPRGKQGINNVNARTASTRYSLASAQHIYHQRRGSCLPYRHLPALLVTSRAAPPAHPLMPRNISTAMRAPLASYHCTLHEWRRRRANKQAQHARCPTCRCTAARSGKGAGANASLNVTRKLYLALQHVAPTRTAARHRAP